jgi:hypothetical protein
MPADLRLTSAFVGLAIAASACNGALGIGQDGGVCPPEGCVSSTPPIRVITTQTKLDVLFMIDNTASMATMQAALGDAFSRFVLPFTELASAGVYADLHIGVVTSDYGAGDIASGDCDASPGGQRGLLQARGAAADPSCQAPSGGVPYIEYAFGANGASSNLPGGDSVDNLATTFGCMADVGTAGCAFTQSLESVYAALHNTTENAGFLRDDAALAVVFVTNHDDGSAPPTTQIYEPTSNAAFGAYDIYRQTEWGIECGDPPMPPPFGDSQGPLEDCIGASSGPGAEFALTRYINFFTAPAVDGGVKPDPRSVSLFAIAAPISPFETLLAAVGSGNGQAPSPAYVACSAPSSSCEVRLQHSCQNTAAPAFFGDPAVRLTGVVESSPTHLTESICGTDPSQAPDYSVALQAFAATLAESIGPACISENIPDPTRAECVVLEETPQPGGTNTQTAIPACSTSGAAPCWKLVATTACAQQSPQSLALDVVLPPTGLSSNSYVTATCAETPL